MFEVADARLVVPVIEDSANAVSDIELELLLIAPAIDELVIFGPARTQYLFTISHVPISAIFQSENLRASQDQIRAIAKNFGIHSLKSSERDTVCLLNGITVIAGHDDVVLTAVGDSTCFDGCCW